MHLHLQSILTLIKNSDQLPVADQLAIGQAVKEIDKILTMTEFKLTRGEKEKRAISILLEETIEELQQKSLTVEKANANLTLALEEVRTTQEQLIRKEKMASLGELIAGIAHEIQNPLNFVNNFSEISIELIDELVDGRTEPASEPALEMELLTDVKENLIKINYHGQRASSIVRGMLGHSRTTPGALQAADLNALVDEYFWLAFHGLRATYTNFNCEYVTQFDASIGKVAIIGQDIGRVLLNLFTNALYALRERQKVMPADYRPTITVTTLRTDEGVDIRIKDNGTGIPLSVQQKIFQPFFTTKPTGEGSGLGLSLSYDIITKGHNGRLTVESWPDQGSEFTIWLPILEQVPVG